MLPDQPIQPNMTIETPTNEGDESLGKSVEAVTTPEVLVASGSPDPQAIVQDQNVTPVVSDVVAPPEINEEKEVTTVKEVDDTAEISGDAQYFSAVKKIIQEDADKPYAEEEDSEKLQKGYLKERFGVDVDMDEEKE